MRLSLVKGVFFRYLPAICLGLVMIAGFQTWRLSQAHLAIEQLRHKATQAEATQMERSLELEREFAARQRQRDAETQRLVTQWRRDMEREVDEATDTFVCGPADVLSPRTRERLRNLAPATAAPDS